MSKISSFVLLISSLAVSACGFHLRGAVVLPEAMQVTTIQGVGTWSEIATEIRDVLQAAGARVLPEPTDETSRLVVLDEEFDRRVLSVGSAGKVAEYELFYRLSYSLLGSDGAVLVPEQSVSMTRDYQFDPNNVLSSEQEENELKREMRQLAVRQMLRRVQATARNSVTAAPVGEGEPAVVPPAQTPGP